MGKLRVAVVGVGHLGQHHARVLASLPETELVGVADTREDQVRTVAERCRTTPHLDYRDLLDKVDAVSIAVPTTWHHPIALEFLERGIPCMVEKPLASTLDQAREIVETARRVGVPLQVGHIERFNAALRAVDGLRDFHPRHIVSERLGTYTFRSTDVGVVFDLMIHDLDLILSWNPSPVKSVAAVGVGVFGGHEDVANARVEFENGCVASLTASRVSYQTTRRMKVWNDENLMTLDFAAKRSVLSRVADAPRTLSIGDSAAGRGRTENGAEPRSNANGAASTTLRVDRVFQGDDREPLALELEEFTRVVRHGGRPSCSGEDALRAIELADAILQSIRERHWDRDSDGGPGPRLLPRHWNEAEYPRVAAPSSTS